jgi:hypothetical protein
MLKKWSFLRSIAHIQKEQTDGPENDLAMLKYYG